MFLNRRDMLCRAGTGLGMLGLGTLLADQGLLAASPASAAEAPGPLAPKQPHFAGKARRVIHFFCNGGPSHVDTFDPKPALAKYAGQPLPETLRTERKTGAAFPSPFKFDKYGQSGLEISEIFREDRRARRQPRGDPLDVCPRAQPRAVADADELRRFGAAAAERRGLGAVWPGDREPEPAGLHRDVPRRLCRSRTRRTGSRPFCPGPIRGRSSTRKHEQLDKLIENIRSRTPRPPCSGGSSICCRS